MKITTALLTILLMTATATATATASNPIICAGILNSGIDVEFKKAGNRAELAFDGREFTVDLKCRDLQANSPAAICEEIIPVDVKYIVHISNNKAYVTLAKANYGQDVYKGMISCE